jgi:hypothetical protein
MQAGHRTSNITGRRFFVLGMAAQSARKTRYLLRNSWRFAFQVLSSNLSIRRVRPEVITDGIKQGAVSPGNIRILKDSRFQSIELSMRMTKLRIPTILI